MINDILFFHLYPSYNAHSITVPAPIRILLGESHIRSENGKYPEFDYNIHGNNTCILDGI